MTRKTLRNVTSSTLISLALALIPSSAAYARTSHAASAISVSWFSRATLRGVLIATWHHLFAKEALTTDTGSYTREGGTWEPLGDG